MTKTHRLLAGGLMALASGVAQPQEAKEHHPPGPAGPAGCKHADMMGSMDQHMRDMHAARDKMVAAKTPQEREAVMAEHMKAMQEGMARMKGMGCLAASGGQGGAAEDGTVANRQRLMEQRMDIMESRMKAMMERMDRNPAR